MLYLLASVIMNNKDVDQFDSPRKGSNSKDNSGKQHDIVADLKDIKNYDAVFKESFEFYKGKDLTFFGVDLAQITETLNPEITQLKVDKYFADIVFKLADGTGLHLEWEADLNQDDILRFCIYHASLTRNHKMSFKTVVFTKKEPSCNSYTGDCLNFKPEIVNLGSYDAEKTLEVIHTQINNGETINDLQLIYLPLYGSNRNPVQIIRDVVDVAKKAYANSDHARDVVMMSFVAANKVISKDEIRDLWEEIIMSISDLKIVQVAVEKTEERMRAETEEKVKAVRAETIRKMKAKGYPCNEIGEIVNLSTKEVEEYLKEA